MEKQFEHHGHTYWITLDPAIHPVTSEAGFAAFVSDKKPDALFWGTIAKHPNGEPMIFADQLTAFTMANDIKKSEIDSKQQ